MILCSQPLVLDTIPHTASQRVFHTCSSYFAPIIPLIFAPRGIFSHLSGFENMRL